MPKMKSHRGASKRFRVKKSGIIKRSSAYKNHMLNKKAQKRKRRLRKGSVLSKPDAKRLRFIIANKK
ncbi:MAG: 50S ribosomal protein L35 [Eubacteriaceae bacterium]|nr:50S ribosomal protein L35 [Eubacteriaceae bacterium]